ncbi:MAG: hypothetical protein L6R37_008127 [Teloschistes peruensis]|nr:MAG: hypothetical protein L6R37_008127 [Teloschistes peruensis]
MAAEQIGHWDDTVCDMPDYSNEDMEPTPTKPGMIANVKNLYRTQLDRHGRWEWVDEIPDGLDNPVENNEWARYALRVHNAKCNDGGRRFQIESIMVQSPLLKIALGYILAGYPGITTTLERLKFESPFKPFLHRWDNLVSALQDEDGQATKSRLEVLHRVLEVELRDDLEARDDYLSNKVITFDTCWMIFEPGTIVYSGDDHRQCAFRLTKGIYISVGNIDAFDMICEKVD